MVEHSGIYQLVLLRRQKMRAGWELILAEASVGRENGMGLPLEIDMREESKRKKVVKNSDDTRSRARTTASTGSEGLGP